MNLAQVTAFFGWATVVQFALLAFAFFSLTVCRAWVLPLHSKILGLPEAQLQRLYVYFFAAHKLIAIAFFFVPYLVLRFCLTP